jgi:hypothetical protein
MQVEAVNTVKRKRTRFKYVVVRVFFQYEEIETSIPYYPAHNQVIRAEKIIRGMFYDRDLGRFIHGQVLGIVE